MIQKWAVLFVTIILLIIPPLSAKTKTLVVDGFDNIDEVEVEDGSFKVYDFDYNVENQGRHSMCEVSYTYKRKAEKLTSVIISQVMIWGVSKEGEILWAVHDHLMVSGAAEKGTIELSFYEVTEKMKSIIESTKNVVVKINIMREPIRLPKWINK